MFFRTLCVMALATALLPAAETTAGPNLSPPFFAFCMDTHDAQKRTLPEQARLLKELGYAGAGHLWLEQVPERIETLEAVGLRLFQIYVRINLAAGDQPPYDPALKAILPLLKGRQIQLALLISGGKPADRALDGRAVEVLRQVADMARAQGIRLVLYPHAGDWLERVEDALRIIPQVNRPNVGVMFNLCHWLKVSDEKGLRPLLQAARPYLWAVSLNGADHAADIRVGKGQMIRPLDRGEFDIFLFLKALKEISYAGPIGLQCYGIPGDAREHLARSMVAWRQLQERLSSVSSSK